MVLVGERRLLAASVLKANLGARRKRESPGRILN
jgi:hypothetical protein